MKYLGITIISPITKIFSLNDPSTLQSIKNDIIRWTALPLSLWGRAEILKMNVLPRLAHIINSTPLKFPTSWFRDIESLFIRFLWNNKNNRISFKKITIPRSRGGLGVPDIYQYYLLYNAWYPLTWAYKSDALIGSWQWLEETILSCNKDISLASL